MPLHWILKSSIGKDYSYILSFQTAQSLCINPVALKYIIPLLLPGNHTLLLLRLHRRLVLQNCRLLFQKSTTVVPRMVDFWFSISSMSMICYLGVVFSSNFDFYILSHLTSRALCESLASVPLYFLFVFFFGRFLFLFVRVSPSHVIFMDSAIGTFRGVGRLRGPCCFSSLMLRLLLRGLSADCIVCFP